MPVNIQYQDVLLSCDNTESGIRPETGAESALKQTNCLLDGQ